ELTLLIHQLILRKRSDDPRQLIPRLPHCPTASLPHWPKAMMTQMASYLDGVPFSGIIRIRDMMYSVERPFRLDQGDLSFDAPASVKNALAQAIVENRTHYVQTTGIPPLVALLAEKLRTKNAVP